MCVCVCVYIQPDFEVLENRDYDFFFVVIITWVIFHIFAAAAAAKSLQSCPTLCDPIDRSPPGSPVPGILQARTLEWVAISFSNAWKWKVKGKSLSHVWLLAMPWTQPTRLLRPLDFPGKSTGVGCHCLLHYTYLLNSYLIIKLVSGGTDNRAFLVTRVVKNLPANARDVGLIAELGRSPGGRNSNPLQWHLWGCTESDTTEAT